MSTLLIYGDQYVDEIHAWVLVNRISPDRHFHGAWISFDYCIDNICQIITIWKPTQIVFEEHSEYGDLIWDAVTSKCDNELNISIERDGKIIFK